MPADATVATFATTRPSSRIAGRAGDDDVQRNELREASLPAAKHGLQQTRPVQRADPGRRRSSGLSVRRSSAKCCQPSMSPVVMSNHVRWSWTRPAQHAARSEQTRAGAQARRAGPSSHARVRGDDHVEAARRVALRERGPCRDRTARSRRTGARRNAGARAIEKHVSNIGEQVARCDRPEGPARTKTLVPPVPAPISSTRSGARRRRGGERLECGAASAVDVAHRPSTSRRGFGEFERAAGEQSLERALAPRRTAPTSDAAVTHVVEKRLVVGEQCARPRAQSAGSSGRWQRPISHERRPFARSKLRDQPIEPALDEVGKLRRCRPLVKTRRASAAPPPRPNSRAPKAWMRMGRSSRARSPIWPGRMAR